MSALNDESERRNLPAGVVTSRILSGSALWIALWDVVRNYCSDLEYDSTAPFDPDGYNSNGFVLGLLNAVGATAIATDDSGTIIHPTYNPISTFIGGNRPVPITEFQSTICSDVIGDPPENG